ncbi:MAG: hypothetical protein ABJQ29_11880 [Luteolibacter sp.]
MIDPKLQPKLLGFAGHRHVIDKDALRLAIRSGLEEMRERLGGKIIAFCSAAAGADLIFLRCCVELRIPAIVILPFDEERFSEDFEDADEWLHATHLMSVALAKYVAPGGKPAPEAYQVVSRILLEWADAFLFAWDGQPQRGAGGTGETVEDAQHLGIPSRIIDTGSHEARWNAEPDAARKARHGFETRKELLEFFDARFS